MKLKKKDWYKNKLIKLKLLETKIFNKRLEIQLKLIDIIFRIKKYLNIIYSYQINNKQILFVGIPAEFLQKFQHVAGKNHIYISRFVWLNGIITNKKSCFIYLNKNKRLINQEFSKIFYKFNNKIDLIVVLDNQFKKNIINESYLMNIPIIYINSFLEKSTFQNDYKIPGQFNLSNKKTQNGIFSSLLLATLKKASKLRKSKKQISLK